MCDLVHWTFWLLFAALIAVPIGCWAIKRIKNSVKSINQE